MSELGWAPFSFALLCWLTLGPLVIYRLLVIEPRLSRKIAPQLAVLVSSPAVLASSWYALTGTADAVFKILAFIALLFTVLTVRLWKMAWGEPYNVAMWARRFRRPHLPALSNEQHSRWTHRRTRVLAAGSRR